jgi:hypothetical protein
MSSGMLLSAGFKTEEKRDFHKKRIGWPDSSPHRTRKGEDGWCESQVRAYRLPLRARKRGEIAEAIRAGAHTMDAVKHLTAQGWGDAREDFADIGLEAPCRRNSSLPPRLERGKAPI